MTDIIKLEDHLDLPDRYFASKAFLMYWWIKKKAVDIKRIKSCRAMKVMKPKNVDDLNVDEMVDSIETSALKEHAKNLKFLLENNPYISGSQNIIEVNAESRRGRVKLICSAVQSRRNSALKIIYKNSNIPEEILKELFFVDSYSAFFLFHYSSASFNSSATNMKDDYDKIDDFAKKLRNTIKLANKVYTYVPRVEDYEWYAPSRDELKLEFTGVNHEEITADSILESEVVVSVEGSDSVVIPGETVPEEERTRRLTAQDRLNQYIQNVIIPRRRDAD